MAHNLITLLEGNPTQSLALRELRAMTSDGVDVRLIADILARAHRVMRRLGLDPADTTPEEVYAALLAAVRTEQWLSLLDETEFVILEVGDKIISFNPIDVVNSYHHELPIERQQTTAAKRGLGWEITRRYQADPRTNDSRVTQVAEKAKWPTEEPQFCRIEFGKPTIVTIGDTATEALISLEKDDVEAIGGKNSRKLAIDLGAKIAAKDAQVQDAVGGAANAAVAFSKLGVQASLMSWLGDDTVGRSTLNYLRGHGVDMSGVKLQKKARTNYHYVLRHGAERTIIAQYEDFDYRWSEPVCQADWVYLSSISGESDELHEGLLSYLEASPQIKLAFQPGAAHISWGKEKMSDIYARSEVVIMNVDEAMAVTGRSVRTIEPLLKSIHELGPNIVIITDGPKGAFAYDGESIFEVPAYADPAKPVDRTGAGDAFAATLVAELARGTGLEQALLCAPISSMSVVQELGAQAGLISSKEIDKYLKDAPADYKITSRKIVALVS